MTAAEMLEQARQNPKPPANLSPALAALWLDAAGEWNAAHSACQTGDPAEGAWVHAYLHRKEGDPDNAGYWYAKAGRPSSDDSLESEWIAIAGALLARAQPTPNAGG